MSLNFSAFEGKNIFKFAKYEIKKPKKEDLIFLQKLIKERRNLKLVPFNSIHKYVKNEMHELIKNNRS